MYVKRGHYFSEKKYTSRLNAPRHLDRITNPLFGPRLLNVFVFGEEGLKHPQPSEEPQKTK